MDELFSQVEKLIENDAKAKEAFVRRFAHLFWNAPISWVVDVPIDPSWISIEGIEVGPKQVPEYGYSPSDRGGYENVNTTGNQS